MSTEVIAAIIALTGVVVSVSVAYVTSVRQASIETQKLRAEIQQEFSRRLFEKRLEVYPDLYAYTSEFIKVIEFGEISSGAVQQFFSQFQAWDSRNSIFFSGPTGLVSYRLRLKLANLASKTDQELASEFSSPDALKELRHSVQELELALKSELGIYAFESPTEVKSFAKAASYREITESVSKSSSPQT